MEVRGSEIEREIFGIRGLEREREGERFVVGVRSLERERERDYSLGV